METRRPSSLMSLGDVEAKQSCGRWFSAASVSLKDMCKSSLVALPPCSETSTINKWLHTNKWIHKRNKLSWIWASCIKQPLRFWAGVMWHRTATLILHDAKWRVIPGWMNLVPAAPLTKDQLSLFLWPQGRRPRPSFSPRSPSSSFWCDGGLTVYSFWQPLHFS